MFRFLNLIYTTPEDLTNASPKSLQPGIYYCKDSKGDWLFRRWTGMIWSQGCASMREAQTSPEQFSHAKDDGIRIVGWYFPKTGD